MMFKILVIQTTNNLSDERAEFLINHRLSFMRFLGRRIEFRRADREHLGAALRTRRGRQMQKCCDASVCQPRQALDQLFICIEKIVTGRLDIVEISEFEWLRERNGRAGCADGHRLPSIRRKTHECGERTKAVGTNIRLQIIGQKILARSNPEAGNLRVHWLATTRSLVTGPKNNGHERRSTRISSEAITYPDRIRQRSPQGVDVTLPTWDPRNQLARARASGTTSLSLLDFVEAPLQRAQSARCPP
jgi:hypothetical protein